MRIAVLSYFDNHPELSQDGFPMSIVAEVTSKVNAAYCKKYGYDYIYIQNTPELPGRHIHYKKIWYALELFYRGYDYIFYMDVDAMFVNHNLMIEELVNEYLLYNFVVGSVYYQRHDPNYPINAGVWLLKLCDQTREFLEHIWNLNYGDPNVKTKWDDIYIKNEPEQRAMIDSLHKVCHTIVPSKRLNSIWNTVQNEYTHGDWIVHLPGSPNRFRHNILTELRSKNGLL